MAAPVRKIIVDYRNPEPNWKADGPAQIFTQRVSFSQFSAAALTGDLDITGFPGLILVEGAFILLRTNFTGGAAATATMSVGIPGNVTAFVAATDVFSTAGATITAPKALVGLTPVPGTFLAGASTPITAGTIRIRVTTTVANTSVLTAGVADVNVRLRAVAYRAA